MILKIQKFGLKNIVLQNRQNILEGRHLANFSLNLSVPVPM